MPRSKDVVSNIIVRPEMQKRTFFIVARALCVLCAASPRLFSLFTLGLSDRQIREFICGLPYGKKKLTLLAYPAVTFYDSLVVYHFFFIAYREILDLS